MNPHNSNPVGIPRRPLGQTGWQASILALGGVGIVLGLATYGYTVMRTIGKEITEITPSCAVATGIATAATRLFYSGHDATGRFSLDDLTGGASVGDLYDTLVSDLKTAHELVKAGEEAAAMAEPEAKTAE